MRLRNSAIGIVFAFSLFFAGPLLAVQSASYSDDEIREAIHEVLQMRHPSDTPEWWRSLGPNAPRLMMEAYSQTTNLYHKIRLIEALGFFETPEVADFLKKAYAEQKNPVAKDAAVQAVANSQGARDREFLDRAMARGSRHMRVRVAKTLDGRREVESRRYVDSMLKREKDGWVASKIKMNRKSKENTQKE